MEIIILIISLIMLSELSFLVFMQYKKNSTNKSRGLKPLIIDTSVLIDGRIVSLIDSGFLSNDLIYIPQSVIAELHSMADKASPDKRSKARLGLDIASDLQAMKNVNVVIYKDDVVASEGVDSRLLEIAKKENGIICTVDYNLNKVALTYKLPVANINNLAKNLRAVYLPGDKFIINLVSKGSDPFQAVGHLDDGTMVVVENASSFLGKSQSVICTRTLQTDAGRMIFARLENQTKKDPRSTGARHNKNRNIRKSDHI